MGTHGSRFRSSRPSSEPPVVYTDDGGSGLLAACRDRFAPPRYEVACDARHTVWIKCTVGDRSFGLAPWLLRKHSMDEVLQSAEAKLGSAREGTQ